MKTCDLFRIAISPPGSLHLKSILGSFSKETLKSLLDGNVICDATYRAELDRRLAANNIAAEAINHRLARAQA